ncbi:MAG TPA: hypothetical protein VKS81_10435, partial [Bacteroidota bacterium]|nr:hypothetical protein [Bacteroidota bacterium]
MSKFRVHLEISQFKLEVEGSREDIPQIIKSVGEQVAGMLDPSAQIIEGHEITQQGNGSDGSLSIPIKRKRKGLRTASQKLA